MRAIAVLAVLAVSLAALVIVPGDAGTSLRVQSARADCTQTDAGGHVEVHPSECIQIRDGKAAQPLTPSNRHAPKRT